MPEQIDRKYEGSHINVCNDFLVEYAEAIKVKGLTLDDNYPPSLEQFEKHICQRKALMFSRGVRSGAFDFYANPQLMHSTYAEFKNCIRNRMAIDFLPLEDIFVRDYDNRLKNTAKKESLNHVYFNSDILKMTGGGTVSLPLFSHMQDAIIKKREIDGRNK